MSIWEMIIIAVGLAMDAFSVSVCKGMAIKKPDYRDSLMCGLYFGGFQGLLPLAGYYLGHSFLTFIEKFGYWAAFLVLLWIGGQMIWESLSGKQETQDDRMDWKTLVFLGVATSIDALSVGVSFSFTDVNIILCCVIITAVTFAFCFVGVKVGDRAGEMLGLKAKTIGGLILVLIGFKILVEHIA